MLKRKNTFNLPVQLTKPADSPPIKHLFRNACFSVNSIALTREHYFHVSTNQTDPMNQEVT